MLKLVQADLFQPGGKMTAVFGNFVEFLVKRGAVIMHPGVNEFVKQHVIPEFLGQQHQFYIQADALFRAAASPPCSLITDGCPAKTKTILPGEFAKAKGQLPFCLQPINSG